MSFVNFILQSGLAAENGFVVKNPLPCTFETTSGKL